MIASILLFLSLMQACTPIPSPVATTPTPAVVAVEATPGHTFTFKNSCQEPVWVGSLGQNGTASIQNGGWKMEPGESRDFQVPVGNSGRIWPRTGCTFAEDGNCPEKGVNCCVTGGCLGSKEQTFALECTQSGVPPVSLLEWTLDAPSGNGPIDYYDMSFVDGWSVPLSMRPVPGSYNEQPDPGIGTWWCELDGCDQRSVCPDGYGVPGSPLSCFSPCQVAVNAAASDQTKYCCSCSMSESITCPDPRCAGQYGCTPYHDPAYPVDMVCNPWNSDPARAWDAKAISYIDAVRKACPKVYSWQFSDVIGTFNCRKSGGLVDYMIEFCPVAPAQ